MSIDKAKIADLVRFIDAFISLDKDGVLDEETVDKHFLNAIDALKNVKFTDEEIEQAKRDVAWKYKIYTTPGQSIVADYEQENWYDDIKGEIDSRFWTRYKNYLIDEKKFSPNIVSTLGDETLDGKLMNYIVNPKADYPDWKRGLIIGDVQSGKTSTYIGFICKAADAGYRVFILLTGTIESLRRQTQERVEEGFIGIDLSADNSGGQRVGVGLDNKAIHATAMTSRVCDFTGNYDKIAVSLGNADAIVFVIKKNTTVLKKLKDWLVSMNADPVTKKIDVPMLLIDDEADNASINTSADKEDPTKINKLIRELSSVFTKANYVSFTATPFANVFIDPESTEKMETQDLFPEDFIVALPTPSNYIGPGRIFGKDGEYRSQIIYIKDAGREKEDGFPFYFKHPKTWEDELPDSLTEAIYAFYIANAIRDLRGDFAEHRSMLINISRFIMVQKYVKRETEEIHSTAYRSIKFNLSSNFNESMKDPVLSRIYSIWDKYYSTAEFSWKDISNTLFDSVESIQIKVVNSSKSSEKLEYPKKESLRVIAIGGLALSRGLTLEGLITSYFYRNTCTYDVLMQMGRWFGYRKNYDDLFRIWTHEDSADWYAEIAEATEQLKDDMSIMRELGLKPKDFGIRVRNDSAALRITAYNKMRNSSDEYEYASYFGGIVETPYLCLNPNVQISNYNHIVEFTEECVKIGYTFDVIKQRGAGEHFVIQNVPKMKIISLLGKMNISKFSQHFDIRQITDTLSSCPDTSIDNWNIAFVDGEKIVDAPVIELCGRKIYKVRRKNCKFDTDTSRLSIGQRGKLGGTSDGIIGITDFNGRSADDIIESAKNQYRINYLSEKKRVLTKEKGYSSDTWFKYISDRNPLLLVYFLDVDGEENQKAQAEKFRAEMKDIPVVGLAMGLPKNDLAATIEKSRYKANKVYNYFERDAIIAEGVEE